MEYGQLPTALGEYKIECKEMMFYQYLPIKMAYDSGVPTYEPRLKCFDSLIAKAMSDFLGNYGYLEYTASYFYFTAKYMYQAPNTSYNRMGYHSDGFMTNDINYVWCDKYPTVFNSSKFNLTQDDTLSIAEMEAQAKHENEVTYPENTLLRLDQFNIHKVAFVGVGCMRTFVKISVSKDKYDLIGNSHNYLLDYDWKMKERRPERNIPQSNLTQCHP